MKLVFGVFAFAFAYRLLKNISGYLRAVFYLSCWKKGSFPIIELQPTIDKIIKQANTLDYQDYRDGLAKAKGVFVSQIKENFSLFFWIDFIVFLPSKLLTGFGLNSKKETHKFIDYLLSALGWGVCFIISLFSAEIKQFLLSLF